MYIDAIIERKKGSEELKVAERIDGKRVLKSIPPIYEFYVEDEYGDQKTINGTMSTKKSFKNYFEMKSALESLGSTKTYEASFNVLFKTLASEYQSSDSPVLNMLFFDIETDFDKKFGYAPPSNPFNRVTAISLYQSWTGKDYVLALAPNSMDNIEAQEIVNKLNTETNNPNSTVILHTNERDMFTQFFELMEDADVLSGWNSEFFDIPYMINRTNKLFGAVATSLWCLWGKKPKEREADMFGKKIITYDLIGRVHLDYLALYKKHAGQVEQSYKLDDIAEKVTSENKVSYEGSLDKLYNEDFLTFLRYSKQDSILLKKIDAKLDYINLHNRLAHKESVLISTTMGSVALIDTAIINQAHKRGEVVFDKQKEEINYDNDYDYGNSTEDFDDDEEIEDRKAAGAWVQDPILGLVDFIGCTDFNSLYPTVLRALGMSTECILGQIRHTYTDAYLNEKISQQRIKSRSKKFIPNWTEAWHGLFATIEFTMVHEKTNDILILDLEEGTSVEISAKELYDLIFTEGSNIVLSANGTLFDSSKVGVIPEILTVWYSERKAQQKMVLDYKHLSKDGLEIPYDIEFSTESDKTLFRTTIHDNDPVYLLRLNWKNKDKFIEICNDNGFFIKDGKLFCNKQDIKYCKNQADFWKQNQQIRKILLNSLYGALLNAGSKFYDPRLGQSVTLSGRSMTKAMASKINEICTGEYKHDGGVVIYGDSVSSDSMSDIIDSGIEKRISIEELYNKFNSTEFIDKGDKQYVVPDILVKTFSTEHSVAYYDKPETIMRHKNVNDRWKVVTETKEIEVTNDHSITVEVDGEIGSYTPTEIEDMISCGCDVFVIVS